MSTKIKILVLVSISLFMASFFVTAVYASLQEGANCGFVSSAPSGNPEGDSWALISTKALSSKFVSPSGDNKITSMGWYTDTDTEDTNFQIGVYSHDSTNDLPESLLASSGNVDKGTGTGWKSASVEYELDASTTYWFGVQVDSTTDYTHIDDGGISSSELQEKTNQTELPDTWGDSDWGYDDWAYAIYAVYEEVSTDSCSCPSSGTWTISGGNVCTLSDTCNLSGGGLTIENGSLNITSSGTLIVPSAYNIAVKKGEFLYIEQGGGLNVEK